MKPTKYTEGMSIESGKYYTCMPDHVYHKTEGYTSKSQLHKLDSKTPFRFFNEPVKPPTRPMQIGTALHMVTLEPARFEDEYMQLPEIADRRKPEYKKAKSVFGEERVLVASECENLNGMHQAIMNNEKAAYYLSLPGWNEISGFVIDEETGQGLRHRFDKLTECGIGIDIKKTQSVHPYELSKTIATYGYHKQDALYSDGYKAITGKELERFIFIFVEETYPHEVAVVELDDISKQIGRDEYRENLVEYKKLLDSKDSFNNNSDVELVGLPEWKLRQYEIDNLV